MIVYQVVVDTVLNLIVIAGSYNKKWFILMVFFANASRSSEAKSPTVRYIHLWRKFYMPTFLILTNMPAVLSYFVILFLTVKLRQRNEFHLRVWIFIILPIDSRSSNIPKFVVSQSLLRRTWVRYISKFFFFLARFENLVVDLVEDETIPTLE